MRIRRVRNAPSLRLYYALQRIGLLDSWTTGWLLGLFCRLVRYERQRSDGSWERFG
jgi:hypothetical protein